MDNGMTSFIIKLAAFFSVLAILVSLWMVFFDDGLSKEERQMLRYTYHQTNFLNKTNIGKIEQKNIDSLTSCHFYGDWEYTKADGDTYLVTFDNQNTYDYHSKKSSRFKGTGQWQWLEGQFIWITGQRKDNNPLLHPLIINSQLTDFTLLEADGRLTVFERLAGDGC